MCVLFYDCNWFVNESFVREEGGGREIFVE